MPYPRHSGNAHLPGNIRIQIEIGGKVKAVELIHGLNTMH